jgi:excisionase family DNA binding protein
MSHQFPPGKLLLTPKEAASLLAISARKLWSLTAAGEITAVKLGRAVRYSPESILAAISSHQLAKREPRS